MFKIINHKSHTLFLRKIVFVLFFSFIPTSLFAILSAKSTGGLVGVAAGIGILFILWSKTRWPAIILGVVGLAGLFLMPTNPIKQELLFQDWSGQLRLNMWGETVEFLQDRPLLGAGLASYTKRIFPYRIDKWIEVFHHPHNIFLTIWVNTGLVGLIGFTWILVWFFRTAFFSIKNHSQTISSFPYFLISSMTIIVVTGLVDSPYIKNDLAILFWLLPALLIFFTTSYTTPKSNT